jgi:hypothetical protein
LEHVPTALQEKTLPVKFLRLYSSANLYKQYGFALVPLPEAAPPPVPAVAEPAEPLEPLDPLLTEPLLELDPAPVDEAEPPDLAFFFLPVLVLSLEAPPSSDLECLLLPKVNEGRICILKLEIVELARSPTVSTHS